MKIERELVPTSTIEAFAELHGLTMVVAERRMDAWQRERGLKRFTAAFKNTDVAIGDGLLRAEYGEGDTEAEAIADYARRISTCHLVVQHAPASRLSAPRFIPESQS